MRVRELAGRQLLPAFDTPESWSFLGGLFDGDGCVASSTPALFISTSCSDLAFSLQKRFSGSVYLTQRKDKGNRALPEYNWRLGGRAGRELGRTLADYTIAKREELLVLIDDNQTTKEKTTRLKYLKKNSQPVTPSPCINPLAYFGGFFTADGHLNRNKQVILTQTVRRRWLLDILLEWFPGGRFVSDTPSQCNCLQVRWSQAGFLPHRGKVDQFCFTHKKLT